MITPITQPVPRTGIDRGADKNRLARHREARALEHHDYENGGIHAQAQKADGAGAGAQRGVPPTPVATD